MLKVTLSEPVRAVQYIPQCMRGEDSIEMSIQVLLRLIVKFEKERNPTCTLVENCMICQVS